MGLPNRCRSPLPQLELCQNADAAAVASATICRASCCIHFLAAAVASVAAAPAAAAADAAVAAAAAATSVGSAWVQKRAPNSFVSAANQQTILCKLQLSLNWS